MPDNKNPNFKNSVEALFGGMDSVVSSKTVVGEPIHVDGTTIIPLVDVSFGMAVGASTGDKKDKGTGGLGGKITPSAVLVIKDNATRLVNIKNQDTMSKLLDMVPDLLDKIKEKKEDKVTEEDIDAMLDRAKEKK